MPEAALLPRPTVSATQTSAPLSLARQHQLIETLEAGMHTILGRGILENGDVSPTSGFSVELEAGTVVFDSGVEYTLPTAQAYTASVPSGSVWLWGILERDPADPNSPTELDTWAFRLTHTTTSDRPVESGIEEERWIPLAEWDTTGAGVDAGTLNNTPTGKRLTDLAGSLATIADTAAEVTAARGSLGSLDTRLDVSLNEDGTLKSAALPSVAGDVTGTVGATVVEKIRGANVPAPTASEDGMVLVYDHVNGVLEWTALPDGGDDVATMLEHLVSTGNSSGTLGGGHSVYVLNVAGGSIVSTLPGSPAAGQQLTLIRSAADGNTNTLTITPNSGQTINGETDSLVLAGRFEAVTLVDIDGAGSWMVLARHKPEYHDVACWRSGKPDAGETVLRFVAARAFRFPASMTGSKGSAGTAATGSSVYSFKKNGVEFATATFAAAGTVPTWSAASSTAFAVGDVLTITAPASQDATLADVALTLLGTLV